MEVNFSKSAAPTIDVASTVAPIGVPPVESAPAVDLTPVASIPTAPVNTAVVPAAPQAVAHASPVELDDDAIGFEDVILPRLNIVQKVGDLSTIFNGGEIILNKEAVIHEPVDEKRKANPKGTGPLNITVLGFRPRQFTEKVEGGKLGLLLNSEADIAKNNGTLDYKEWKASVDAAKAGTGTQLRRFERLATAVLLVERPAHIPDEDHVLFSFECEGRFYAIALWSMKGTAYTNGAKKLFTARKLGHLKKGYKEQSWQLTTALEKYSENYAYIPVLSTGPKNTETFKAFCADILGSGK